jgi:hypothetical protein
MSLADCTNKVCNSILVVLELRISELGREELYVGLGFEKIMFAFRVCVY